MFDTTSCRLEPDVASGSTQQEKSKLISHGFHWTTTAFLSIPACYHLFHCLIYASLNVSLPGDLSPQTRCPSNPPRSPSRKKYNIYLGLFEFTHPYHWVHSLSLPLALRWISLGLIDITLVMKYAYHDQRLVATETASRELAGVDALLKTMSISGSRRA